MAHFIRQTGIATSGNTSNVSRRNAGRGLNNVSKRLSGQLQAGDLDRKNRYVGGNTQEHVTRVTFPHDREIFVSHSLGYRVDNFDPVSPNKAANFFLGTRPPNKNGMWIRTDTPGVTVRIRMYGQRQQRRG